MCMYVCICINLQIYLETSSPQQANKVPKLLAINYVAKNWALVMMLKALPSLHTSTLLLNINYDYLPKKHYTHSSNQCKIPRNRPLFFFGRNLLE